MGGEAKEKENQEARAPGGRAFVLGNTQTDDEASESRDVAEPRATQVAGETESSEASEASEASEVSEERRTRLVPGSVIPGTRLQLVRWLGQGGMGVVFEVRHLDIERSYAAKLLHSNENPARMRRFRAEARTISQIGSPYIVEIFDFKELSDGRLMYLMELVDGPSLFASQRDLSGQRAEPCEPARLIGLARQVCKGLQDAHEVGFVHRDIKPENIVLGVDGVGREQVKLVDFGLAALLEGPKEANRGGTPAYMSPEQCQGLDADARTDIYSFGVTLYELACGRLPFVHETERAMREDHLFRDPKPPSQIIEGATLPPGFDELILRCMAKDPDERYASAALLEAALIDLQLRLGLRTAWDDLPVPQLSDEREQRRLETGLAELRSNELRAQRRRVWAGTLLVAAVGIGAIVGWVSDRRHRDEIVAAEQVELLELEKDAVSAAARARWIYPNPRDTERVTAYRAVLELERLEYSAGAEVAAQLRRDFAAALTSLGDSYWLREGGQSFAAEFYAQSLVFVPDDPDARERAGLTPLELLELRDRAAAGDFPDYELEALEPLVALAEDELAERFGRLAAIHRSARVSTRRAAQIEALLGDLGDEVSPEVVRGAGLEIVDGAVHLREPSSTPEPSVDTGGSGPSDRDAVDGTGGETEGGETEGGETEGGETEGEVGSSASSDTKTGPSESGTSKAKAIVADAKAAFNAGKDGRAEELYHQALRVDGRNFDALLGLHLLYFDVGKYRQALTYAKKALEQRPKRGDLNIYVGDSCVKVVDYACAEKHYDLAKKYGDKRAKQRLDYIHELTGR